MVIKITTIMVINDDNDDDNNTASKQYIHVNVCKLYTT